MSIADEIHLKYFPEGEPSQYATTYEEDYEPEPYYSPTSYQMDYSQPIQQVQIGGMYQMYI